MGNPMWKLTIVDDQGKETKLALARTKYSVGRGEDNTVRLTDRNISRQHLLLHRQDDKGWVVEDLNSYNGCYINGVRVVGSHPLNHGDLLQLGDYRIELVDESILAAAAEGPSVPLTNPVAASLRDRPDRLVIVDGSAAGTEFPLEGERIVIGRAEDVDISINHSSVSRIHAEIVSLGAGVYEIFDRGSSNGLRVNGMKFERRVIEDDDEIELGSVRLRFVARGRIFRPGASARMFTPSVGGVRVWAARSPAQRFAMVASIAIVTLTLVIVIVARLASDRDTPVGSAATRATPDQALLEEAKTMSVTGKHDDAHRKLMELSLLSPLRESSDVLVIEGRWADEMFARAAQARSDPRQCGQILKEISAAPLVDAERRRRAAEMMVQLDTGSTDPSALRPFAQTGSGSARGAAKPRHAPPESSSDNIADSKAGAKNKGKGSTGSSSKDVAAVVLDMSKSSTQRNAEARAQLEAKVRKGTATQKDIDWLRSICRAQKDQACVNSLSKHK